jgi:hypothetical protein
MRAQSRWASVCVPFEGHRPSNRSKNPGTSKFSASSKHASAKLSSPSAEVHWTRDHWLWHPEHYHAPSGSRSAIVARPPFVHSKPHLRNGSPFFSTSLGSFQEHHRSPSPHSSSSASSSILLSPSPNSLSSPPSTITSSLSLDCVSSRHQCQSHCRRGNSSSSPFVSPSHRHSFQSISCHIL